MTTAFHDNEAELSVNEFTDTGSVNQFHVVLIEYPDKLVLVGANGPVAYEPPPEPYEGYVEHLYAWIYRQCDGTYLADRVFSHLYGGHPPRRDLPPGFEVCVPFSGEFRVHVQNDVNRSGEQIARTVIARVLDQQLDAALDVFLDTEEADLGCEYALSNIRFTTRICDNRG